MTSLQQRLAAASQKTFQIAMTPAELGAATDIIAEIYKGSPNKREYNKRVRSITEVITQLLAIRGKSLIKGTVLVSIQHSIDISSQEVKYIFVYALDQQGVADAFA
jgi:hypothetical protein